MIVSMQLFRFGNSQSDQGMPNNIEKLKDVAKPAQLLFR